MTKAARTMKFRAAKAISVGRNRAFAEKIGIPVSALAAYRKLRAAGYTPDERVEMLRDRP